MVDRLKELPAGWRWGAAAAGLLAVALLTVFAGRANAPASVSYNADVRPIFNDRCITCHGGVKREAGLSLLFREDALQPTESGAHAIVPGAPGESELLRRVRHDHPDERMPPDGDPLTEAQIDRLEAWIAEGAPWETHWAYVPPTRPALPPVEAASWPANEVDRFVLARLEAEGLTPSAPAACGRLLRRLHLDLVGLPPTPERVDAYCAAPSPAAYVRVVDSLLATPRFGERWAAMWLDLARYADSQGYEKDPHRSIWKYRDWVIRAFNEDLPFDRFTIRQLAGDLLPQADKAQLIATAFHRNTMTNTEGGTSDEEFRVAAVLDRVNTTMEVWQGVTFECVQCHSHPYDPFRHEEYYEVYAFFNNTQDADRDDDRPRLPTFDDEEPAEGEALRARIGRVQATVDSMMETPALVEGRHAWEDHIREALASSTDDVTLDRSMLPGGADLLTRVLKIVNQEEHERALSDQEQIEDLYARVAPELAAHRARLKALHEELAALDPVYTPILQELPPGHSRTTHVFERGNWLVPGEAVERDVPGALNAWPDHAPRNRLGLARWLVDEANPLTARVVVNRFWAQLFGAGIVSTLGDFGTEGARPTHPKLLDWLAVRFVQDHGWRVKPLLRDLVTSATYRQASRVGPELLARDPRNRLLARGPRVRLTAEQVRDQALAVSGLLSEKMYGPSVMPPQPEGIWNNPYDGYEWTPSTGDDRYRRALYTYWKRTSPYPSMVVFDASSREVTVSQRVATNTPLQALVTMNDPVYVEAARALADRMADRGGARTADQVAAGYRLALQRPPEADVQAVLERLYADALAHYRSDPEAAAALTGVGTFEAAGPERAALTVVANAIMNLDAFVTKS